jgi:chlorobactene glucosyltransferase
MLLTIIFINTLFIMALYALTLAFYILLKPVEPANFVLRKSGSDNKEMPLVSVLVPARNEETKIGRCIESLLAQDYPNFELIVIDDRSTDSTGEIIARLAERDPRIKFVKGKDAPSGWIGKCNALAHAVGYASGDWFVFTDADTYHHKNSIADAVKHGIDHKIDLMSFVPNQELGSAPEKLIMPVLLSSFLIGDPFHSVNDPRAQRAYAYGQYILCRRSSYLAVGGHRSVRDEIVEDHALARVFKEKGFKIEVADGKSLYKVRMYTDLESLWQGWTKNLYSFIDSKPHYLVLLLSMMNTVIIAPWLWLAYVIWLYSTGDAPDFTWRLAALVVVQLGVMALWQKRTSEHHEGSRWYHFFMQPIGCIMVNALYLHSAYLVHSGSQVNWKGRRYVVNTHKTIEPSDADATASTPAVYKVGDVPE